MPKIASLQPFKKIKPFKATRYLVWISDINRKRHGESLGKSAKKVYPELKAWLQEQDRKLSTIDIPVKLFNEIKSIVSNERNLKTKAQEGQFVRMEK